MIYYSAHILSAILSAILSSMLAAMLSTACPPSYSPSCPPCWPPSAILSHAYYLMESIVIVSGAANSLVFSIYFLFSYLINTAIPFLKRIKLGIDRLGILFQNFNIIYQQIKKMLFKKNICLITEPWREFTMRYTVEAGIHCKKKKPDIQT